MAKIGSKHCGEKVGFYSSSGKKTLKDVEQECNMIRFTFHGKAPGRDVENGLG